MILAILFSLLPLILLASQENPAAGDPGWVDYEKGRLELGRKDYGKALFWFKNALSEARVMPEAELGIGDVFFFQGDYTLAEKQYLKSWEQRKALSVPDMQYDVLYRLARLYLIQKKYGKMEENLNLIIKSDGLYNETKRAGFRQQLVKLYTNKGFDEMFRLNRFEESFATSAHAQLAYFKYISWDFSIALDYALFGIIPLVTESMTEIRRFHPDYQYTTLTEFLRDGLFLDSVRSFLEDREFFKRLYYLALISCENITVRDRGIELLKLLDATDAAGDYQRLAGLQLKKPWRENRFDTELSGPR
jgi:tetratricopeptide (TPR) repeat protein